MNLLVSLTLVCAGASNDGVLGAFLEWDGISPLCWSADAVLDVCSETLGADSSATREVKLRVLLQRARLLACLRRLEDAKRDVEEHLRLQPGDPDAMALLANILIRDQEPNEQSRKILGEVFRSHPQHYSAHYSMSKYFLALKDPQFQQALPHLRRCLDTNPADGRVLYLRAYTHLSLGQFDACIRDATAALSYPTLGRSDQDTAALYLIRSRALEATGLYHAAYQNALACYSLDKTSERSASALAAVAGINYMPNTVLLVSSEMRRLRPKEASGYSWSALALAQRGRTAEALPLAERALQLAPTDPYSWSIYAHVQFMSGNTAACYSALQRHQGFKVKNWHALIVGAFAQVACPQEELRFIREGIEICQVAVKELHSPMFRRIAFTILAIGQAQAGEFEGAITALADAKVEAEKERGMDQNINQRLDALRKLFEAKKPYVFDPQKDLDFPLPPTVMVVNKYD